jgi:hypothetical protein
VPIPIGPVVELSSKKVCAFNAENVLTHVLLTLFTAIAGAMFMSVSIVVSVYSSARRIVWKWWTAAV